MINIKSKNFFYSQEVNQSLEEIIDQNALSNAYIFYGPKGIGKKQKALDFIEKILKQNSSDLTIKRKIEENNHPDFMLIEPTYLSKGSLINRSDIESTKKSNKESIRIDQIRSIKAFLGKKSIQSEKKIILIIDADLLNESASNCLLKTLEEPTSGIFILLTEKIYSLLETITSRCQKIKFNPYSESQLNNFINDNLDLKNEISKNDINFQEIINLANGSPGKLLQNIEFWNEISDEIKLSIELPPKDSLEILTLSKLISEELNISQQIFLIDFLQYSWWRKVKNKKIIKHLEVLKNYIKNYIQPRLSWEIILLKISFEEK